MTDKTNDLRDPSRRTVLGAGTVLLGAMSSRMATPVKAETDSAIAPGEGARDAAARLQHSVHLRRSRAFLRQMAFSSARSGISEEERRQLL